MNENPWALGALVLILAGLFGLFELTYRFTRRRKRETSMTDEQRPTDLPANWSGPPHPDTTAAEQVIAASRAEAWTAPDAERVQPVGEDDADSEPPRFAVGGPISAAPEHVGGEESQRLAELMHTDPRLIADPLGAPLASSQPTADPIADGPFRVVGVPIEDTFLRNPSAPQPSRNILAGRPVTGTAPVAAPPVRQTRELCEHCNGSGYMPSISDYLRESVALVGASGDEIVKAFYAELLGVAPDLAGLFPPDLLTTDETKGQRDKLLKALVALSDLYDPDDPAKMAKLDTALSSFGRSHAAFARPDGTVKGATWEEYAAVKTVLFATLVAAAGSAWMPEYTESWSQAYDYAAAVMVAEQYRSGFTSPRFPRA